MGTTRRKFTLEFKKKIVLEALKERFSIQELAVKYGIRPQQITDWKRHFIEKSDLVFGKTARSDNEVKDQEKLIELLYSQIGQLKVENDFLKKKIEMNHAVTERREMVERDHAILSIVKQCQLLVIERSVLYYTAVGESSLNGYLMRRIDEHFLTHPFKGSRRMCEWLKERGLAPYSLYICLTHIKVGGKVNNFAALSHHRMYSRVRRFL